MKKKLAYMHFLHLANALDIPTIPSIDAVEERILQLCAGYWFNDISILVTDFAKMLPGVSERTVHRRLKSLVDKGMLCLEKDNRDKRVKHIRPTKLSEKYFVKLNEVMLKTIEEIE